MAIYQLLIYVIPKKSVEAKFGRIPDKLEIKHEYWEKYWAIVQADNDTDKKLDFEDALTINWWNNVNVDIRYIEQKIDTFISRTDWGELEDLSWKSEKTDFDHDVNIDFNIEKNEIEEFQFRTDLSDTKLNFLRKMLELCSANNWILMDERGNLCNPDIQGYFELIKNSNAESFLKNPQNYLDNLNND